MKFRQIWSHWSQVSFGMKSGRSRFGSFWGQCDKKPRFILILNAFDAIFSQNWISQFSFKAVAVRESAHPRHVLNWYPQSFCQTSPYIFCAQFRFSIARVRPILLSKNFNQPPIISQRLRNKTKSISFGCRHSSVDSSAPSSCRPGFDSHARHLCFYHL